jgi:hypothetical protein
MKNPYGRVADKPCPQTGKSAGQSSILLSTIATQAEHKTVQLEMHGLGLNNTHIEYTQLKKKPYPAILRQNTMSPDILHCVRDIRGDGLHQMQHDVTVDPALAEWSGRAAKHVVNLTH